MGADTYDWVWVKRGCVLAEGLQRGKESRVYCQDLLNPWGMRSEREQRTQQVFCFGTRDIWKTVTTNHTITHLYFYLEWKSGKTKTSAQGKYLFLSQTFDPFRSLRDRLFFSLTNMKEIISEMLDAGPASSLIKFISGTLFSEREHKLCIQTLSEDL